MRSDLLSKRIFMAGCFGLPWLWIVHLMYNGDLEKFGSDADSTSEASTSYGLLDADEHFPEEPTNINMSTYQIAAVRKSWVAKCRIGALSVLGLWVLWVALAQGLKRQLAADLYVHSPNDEEWTGW